MNKTELKNERNIVRYSIIMKINSKSLINVGTFYGLRWIYTLYFIHKIHDFVYYK